MPEMAPPVVDVKVEAPVVTVDVTEVANAVTAAGLRTVAAVDRVAEEVSKPSKAVFNAAGDPVGVVKVDRLN